MSPFITVEKRLPTGPNHEMKITGIFASEDQAKRALGEEHAEEPVYEWAGPHQPKFDEFVEIREGQVQPIIRSRIFDAIENALRHEEIAHLYQMIESQQKYTSSLEQQLQKMPTIGDRGRGRLPTERRVRDVHILDDPVDAQKIVVADFVLSEQPTLSGQIMMSASQDVAKQLNRHAQQSRIADGSFDNSHGLAHEDILLHTGDRVQFFKTNEDLGVSDLDLGDVVKLFPEWRTVAVSLDRHKADVSGVILVDLRQYGDLDLGYATTYERGMQMELTHAFVLADQHTPTRQFVDHLTCFHVEAYADRFTAAAQFADWLRSYRFCEAIDLEADPLGLYP